MISKVPWLSWYRITNPRDPALLHQDVSARRDLLCSALDLEVALPVDTLRPEKGILHKAVDRSVVITVLDLETEVREDKGQECVVISWLASVVEPTVDLGKSALLRVDVIADTTSHDLDRALCRFWLRGHCAKGPNCE
jgi:hypothetical protein